MKFTKMQGLGNDYVYVDCTRQELPDPEKQQGLSATGILGSVLTD